MKWIIIGEAPNRIGDPTTPIEGRLGRRLAKLAWGDDANIPLFLAGFDKTNLLRRWPGARNGKGSAWNVEKARRAAKTLVDVMKGRMLVLLGRRVAAAFEIKPSRYFKPHALYGVQMEECPYKIIAFVVPHPTGINRWYNDPLHRKTAGAFMRFAYRQSMNIAKRRSL